MTVGSSIELEADKNALYQLWFLFHIFLRKKNLTLSENPVC